MPDASICTVGTSMFGGRPDLREGDISEAVLALEATSNPTAAAAHELARARAQLAPWLGVE